MVLIEKKSDNNKFHLYVFLPVSSPVCIVKSSSIFHTPGEAETSHKEPKKPQKSGPARWRSSRNRRRRRETRAGAAAGERRESEGAAAALSRKKTQTGRTIV